MNINHKSYNAIIKTIKNGLTSLGLDVKRRDLEAAVAPALSQGKSHDVFVAELKSMPKTATGVIMTESQEAISSLSHKLKEIQISLDAHERYLTESKAILSDFFKEDNDNHDFCIKGLPYSLIEAVKDNKANLTVVGYATPDQVEGVCEPLLTLSWGDFTLSSYALIEFDEDNGVQFSHLLSNDGETVSYLDSKLNDISLMTTYDREYIEEFMAELHSFVAFELNAKRDIAPFSGSDLTDIDMLNLLALVK